MKNRQLIIIAALAIPIIGLVILSHSTPKNPPPVRHIAAGPARAKRVFVPRPKEVAIADIKKRLANAEAMTPEQFAVMRKRNRMLPPEVTTVEQYRVRVKARLAQVEAMTDEQWKADEEARAFPNRKPPVAANTNNQATPVATATTPPTTTAPADIKAAKH